MSQSRAFDWTEPPRRLTWSVSKRCVRSAISDYLLLRQDPTKIDAAVLVETVVRRNEAACARDVLSTYLVGERKEQRTTQVHYYGTVRYCHVEEVDAFVEERSWWRELFWMAILPVLVFLEPVRHHYKETRFHEGEAEYKGSVPFTYTHTTCLDPFIQDRMGGELRPYHEEVRYDNTSWANDLEWRRS